MPGSPPRQLPSPTPISTEVSGASPAPPAEHGAVALPILVVDDERSLRHFLQLFLERQGHRVVTAAGGLEAADRLARGEHFGLILTDMMMPAGDGEVVLEAARRHTPEVPAVLMTALPLDAVRERAAALGAVQVVAKPFCLSALRELLASQTHRQAA